MSTCQRWQDDGIVCHSTPGYGSSLTITPSRPAVRAPSPPHAPCFPVSTVTAMIRHYLVNVSEESQVVDVVGMDDYSK